METGGMEDLSDGVSKLADFSTVLSSVTRTLDKNVRRLESEFGKANVAIKEIKALVEEQSTTVTRLKDESDQQKQCLEDAVTTTVDAGNPILPSKFLSNKLDAVIRLDHLAVVAATVVDEEGQTQILPVDSWTKIKQMSDTPNKISVDQAVNDAVHLLNSTMLEERKLMDKGAVGSKKRITKASTPAEAIGALIIRMYEAENALAIQSSVNEALVKALRDETYLKNSHNHVVSVCETLDGTMRSMISEATKLQKRVSEMQLGIDVLQQTLEKTRLSTEEVARGGRLRIEKRLARLVDQQHDDEPEDEWIEWGLDSFTLLESDLLLGKVRNLERRVFGTSGLEARVGNIDMAVDEINSNVQILQEQQQQLKDWQEQNSNQMNVKIAKLRTRWAEIMSDITFGLNQWSSENDRVMESNLAGNKSDYEDAEEEEEREEPLFIEKLGNLSDSIESALSAFEPMRTPDETLDYLCPQLDIITAQAEELIKMDLDTRVAALEGVTTAATSGPTFANIKSLNPQLTLKDMIVEACTASIVIIDERVPKVHMRRRLDKLEESAVVKEDFDRVRRGCDLLKKGLDRKADLREVLARLKKKASLEDLKRARQAGGFQSKGAASTGRGGSAPGTPGRSGTGRSGENAISSSSSGGGGGGGGGDGHFASSSAHSPAVSVHEESSMESYADSFDDKWEDFGGFGAKGGGGGGGGGVKGGYDDYEEDNYGDGDGDGDYDDLEDDEGGVKGKKNRKSGGGGGLGLSSGTLAAGRGGMVDAASAAALAEVTTRVDSVARQLRDLKDALAGTVPREEVHEALQAVLHEVKLVKLNSINVNRFKQGLDTKADAEEVRKLVTTLNEAVGDMMGTNIAAAGKAKCLLCDKPVGAIAKPPHPHTQGFRRDASPLRGGGGSVNQLADEESSAAAAAAGSGPRPTSVPRLNTSSSLSRLPHEKAARITTELAVLRNTIDLPLMDNNSSPSKIKGNVEARVRGGGAAGFGASYTENSR